MRHLAPILALPLVAALASASIGQEDATKSAARSARAHVIHFTDGRVLRVKARPPVEPGNRDSRWEIRQGTGKNVHWVEVASERIARAVLESELLKQARSLERRVKRGDNVARAAYADWLAIEGLHVEALAQLDRILDADPDDANARAIIRRAEFPVGLPRIEAGVDERRLEAFLAAGAAGSATIREIAVQRLKSAAFPDESGEVSIAGLEQVLLAELVNSRAKRRAFATLCLRRLQAGRHSKPLLARAILDSSEKVRVGAALALRDAEDPALILPALRALESARTRVRNNAVQALGNMNYAAAVAPLMSHLVSLQGGSRAPGAPRSNIYLGSQTAYIQDYDVEVASNSAIADPVINVLVEGNVLDVAVVGVHDYGGQTERATVRRSLARLTGASPGNTTARWKRWWHDNGDSWLAANVQREPAFPTSRGY